MAEYIEKWSIVNRLIDIENEFQQYKPFHGFEHAMYRKICEAEIAIGKAQAADVAPVKHGRWVFGKDLPYSWGQIIKNKYHLYCSECLEQAFNRSEDNDPDFDVDTLYCPNCGAKMDEVIE